MDLQNMSFKTFVKKLINETDSTDREDFEDHIDKDIRLLNKYRHLQEIWNESGKLKVFERINIIPLRNRFGKN
jgi:hypothetical protein